MTPQGTDPGLPVSVQESLAEAWVGGDLLQGQGFWLKQTWEMQHVRTTTEAQSRQPANWRTIIPKNSSTVVKVLGTTTDFPTWGSGKGTENP